MAVLKIVYKGISELTPYERNPRHNDAAVDAVAASIKEFGFRVPIIIDGKGGIIAGHTRLKAAKQLGMTKVPCIVADDLTEAQIKAFRLADNKTAELSTWDYKLLTLELEELETLDFDMSPFGFDDLFIDHEEDADRAGASPWERMGDEGDDGVLFSFGAIACKVGRSVYEDFLNRAPDANVSEWVSEVIRNALRYS